MKGDADHDGISVAAGQLRLPGNAAIRDAGGNDADLTYDAIDNARHHKVDAVMPEEPFPPGRLSRSGLRRRRQCDGDRVLGQPQGREHRQVPVRAESGHRRLGHPLDRHYGAVAPTPPGTPSPA